MVDVITVILINRPLKMVSEFAANPNHAPEWYVNIKSAECLPGGQEGKTSKPVSVGSQIAFVAHFMGRKLSYIYEVVEMSDKKFVMKTAQGPFPMETTYEWEALNAHSTRMTLRNRGNPTGFSKLLAPFMSIMMRKANQNDLKRLKQLLEKN